MQYEAHYYLGGGKQAEIFIRLLQKLGQAERIEAVVDSSPAAAGRLIAGLRVVLPREAQLRQGVILILCHDYFTVLERLEAEGCEVCREHDIYYIVEELWKRETYFGQEKLECCPLCYSRWWSEAYQDKGNGIMGLFEDGISREVLAARLGLLRTGNYTDFYLSCPVSGEDAGDAYFSGELWRNKLGGREILVDCGAYTGDSALCFMKATGGRFRKIISFEPDRDNYRSYLKNIQDARCKAYPYGVGSQGTGSLAAGRSGAYMEEAAEEGKEGGIRVVALDDFLRDVPVTLIKMDIEGAELSALKGAERVISRLRPRLAVSVYHRPEDIIEIPLWIDSLHCGYRFRLRQHCYRGDKFDIRETILYAEA